MKKIKDRAKIKKTWERKEKNMIKRFGEKWLDKKKTRLTLWMFKKTKDKKRVTNDRENKVYSRKDSVESRYRKAKENREIGWI